jgi:coenzyme F420-0:L-glutamate ligase/coenzyme F420-1:gamma-L-glutamate ligase
VSLPSFTALALDGVPLVKEGDNLAQLVLNALDTSGEALQDDDVLVIASKIVSKAEGCLVQLSEIEPGERAQQLAAITGKDPRMVQLILDESVDVSRASQGVLVVEHHLGFVSANAGIDQSNTSDDPDAALLLPRNPDASARCIQQELETRTGKTIAVVISDTHGRPFRMGNIGVALGVAGMMSLVDKRGEQDLFGRTMQITMQAYGDLVASAAHLLSGEGAEGRPLVLLRGLNLPQGDGRGTDLNRPREHDLYR